MGRGQLPEAVLGQVEKILQSRYFIHAEKLSRFLRFTVTEALQGHANRLKEYVLGVEVFGRRASFDPRVDPIVRVQAGKLRARLKEYYETDGRNDPIAIVYNKGGYAPVIEGRGHARANSAPRSSLRRRWKIAVVVVGLVVIIGLISHYTGLLRKTGMPPRALDSVAVLPFLNFDAQQRGDYFSDGLTEELINSLSRIDGLRVAARTSVFRYKGRNEDIRRIGAELNVGTVLEGSVRSEGDRLRITARLISVADGFQLWARTYERERSGVFTIQDEITDAIVGALQMQLSAARGVRASKGRPGSMEAYYLYLQGRYFCHKRDRDGLRKAADCFQQALAKDPNYAAAFAGLADTYSLTAAYELEPVEQFAPKAVIAARKAVKLDSGLAEAHAALGFALATFMAEWADAEKAFHQAIALNPGYATAHQWYASSYLVLFGRLDEALREMQTALSVDPLSPVIHHDLGRIYTYRHEFDKAVEQYRKAIELDPGYARSHAELAFALERLGERDAARREFERAVEVSGGQEGYVADLGRFYAATGEKDKALEILKAIRQSACPYHLASIYAALNRTDEALQLLEIGFRSRRSPALLVDRFAGLRGDPRYRHLLHEVGLPDRFTVTAR